MDGENTNQNAKGDEICYGIVGNIPGELHSADIRGFFSQFIEGKGFLCFHYRHRPEVQKDGKTDDGGRDVTTHNTYCCIIKIYKYKMDEFKKMYHGQNWVNKAGKLLKEKALISTIQINNTSLGGSSNLYQTWQEKKQSIRSTEDFTASDLKKIPELSPPPVMPNGNVGTPLSVFIELIRSCKFPPHLIKKLGLTFPRSKIRRYGNVPFDYDVFEYENDEEDQFDQSTNSKTTSEQEQISKTTRPVASGAPSTENDWNDANVTENSKGAEHTDHCACKTKDKNCNSNTSNHLKTGKHFKATRSDISVNENESMRSGSESSDGELEEWDRHEALHNDVTTQERTKERLFEENIELKWEKGGSGLVWYTDAAFWKQQEEADFDEETTDDWDVDMSIYEEEGAGDMDAKTLLQLRVEKQWRKGNDIDLNRVGSFEKYTRGIGGRVMRKQGWKEGQTLGSSQVGITEPIPSDGQKPSSKRGLGYYGEKLNRFPKKPRPTREAVISTIYDHKEKRNLELFESDGPYTIQYRDNVEFVPETSG